MPAILAHLFMIFSFTIQCSHDQAHARTLGVFFMKSWLAKQHGEFSYSGISSTKSIIRLLAQQINAQKGKRAKMALL
jgi:hypothetical protein